MKTVPKPYIPAGTLRRHGLWLGCLCATCLLCPPPAQAYLDPGTGSMLLSALVGIAATLFFMLKSFYYKAAGLFFRLSGVSAPAGTDKDIVFYCEGRQYWNSFRPVLEAMESMGQRAVYLTSDPEDPGLSFPWRYGTARYIGTGSRAFAVLNMLEADVCVLTTPGLDVLQIRRSPGVKHYAHLVHSVTDMAIYKLFSFDYFDSVLCSGPHQMRSLRALEALRGTEPKLLLETGCPYMDVLADDLEAAQARQNTGAQAGQGEEGQEICNQMEQGGKAVHILSSSASDTGKPRVLVAPTWGRNGLLSRFGLSLLKPLADAGFALTIRPHPQSFTSEKALMGELQNALSDYPGVDWDRAPNGFAAMLQSDLLISDLSGIVFDYAFILERPVITIQFQPDLRGLEAADLPWPAWELDILPHLGAQIQAGDIAGLPGLIASLPERGQFAARMRELRAQSMYNFRSTGPAAARQLRDIQNSLPA